MTKNHLLYGAFLWITVICGIYILQPLITGGFILDDWVHYPKMAGGIDSTVTLFNFLFNETGGSGRPLSFLTLLIEDYAWPTDARPYKFNNILFHAINFLLIAYLAHLILTKLTTSASQPTQAIVISVLILGVWFISPFQISAVALTIQRMTILSTSVMLVGLIIYIKLRPESGYSFSSHWPMLALQGALTVVGVLFKENAILLPLYLGCIELLFLLSNKHNSSIVKTDKLFLLCLLAPVALFLVTYLGLAVINHEKNFQHRDFTFLQRILIEPQLLFDYLYKFFFLRTSETGPYHDDLNVDLNSYFLAKSAIVYLAWIAIVLIAYKIRKKSPWAIFAVSWFLLGHSLESTVLPLELYFEHRNYMPFVGIIIALLGALHQFRLWQKKTLIAFISVYFFANCFLTYHTAQFWGNQLISSRIWLVENPKSQRASLEMMNLWLQAGQTEEAQKILSQAIENHPEITAFKLTALYYTSCGNMHFDYTPEEVAASAANSPIESGSIELLKILFDRYNINPESCKDLSRQQLTKILQAYIDNPNYSKLGRSIGILHTLQATAHIWQGDLDATIESFNAAHYHLQSFYIRLDQAYLLATAGLFDQSWVYIEKAKRESDKSIFASFWKKDAISEYEKIISEMQQEALKHRDKS